jgi:hypothetical protein
LSDRVCGAVTALFAVLTIAVNGVVAFGGNGYALLVAVIGAFLAVLAGALVWRRHAGDASGRIEPEIPEAPARSEATSARSVFWIRASAILGLLAWAGYVQFRSVVPLWWAIVTVLTLAAVASPWTPPREPVERSRTTEATLWLVAAACAVLTLVCHRPDTDDTLYVNFAVAVVDHPGWRLLAQDTMQGIAGLPLLSPVYRAHSFELLNGALSLLTGIPPIACFHWISAGLAGLLVPLCYARLFRLLMPRRWLWGVTACLLFLVANGDVHRSFGNFAFVRLFQGKAIFLTAALPLVYAYALEHASRPSWRSWLRLFAAQVCAMGLTSSAIWVAPYSAGLALLGAARPNRRGLVAVGTGALASSYIVGAGLLLRSAFNPDFLRVQTHVPGYYLQDAFDSVLGGRGFELLAAGAILLTWAMVPAGLARRFAVAVPLGVFALAANPYLEPLVIANLVGREYWRSLWAVPLPILVALLSCAPLVLERRGMGRRWPRAAVLAGWAALVFLVPRYLTLSAQGGPRRQQGVRIGVPTYKVPLEEFAWAEKLNQSVTPEAVVLAPEDVSPWIPTLRHHAYPLQLRTFYTLVDSRSGRVPQEDLDRRSLLTAAVSHGAWASSAGSRERVLRALADGIPRYHLAGVCLAKNAGSEPLRGVLREFGFRLGHDGPRYEIWVRVRR